MTYLTFANFFNFIYGWVGAWCTLTFIIMMTRRGKEWADYDVALFRFAVAGTTLAVFINRVFNESIVIHDTPLTVYLAALVVFHSILAYAAPATCIRIIRTIISERRSVVESGAN